MSGKTIYVIDGNEKLPFLRGMITHALMERGLNFQQAYEAANLVRDRVRPHRVIQKRDLGEVIGQVIQERFGHRDLHDPTERPSPFGETVFIKTDQTAVPFSKGLLSQSLQAPGLDPSAAYDVAREIEMFLLQEKIRELTRDQLRRLIYDTIRHNYGETVAERYLLWRCFQAPGKPFIILFGGATGTGKSSLAAEVARRLGIRKILSTDALRQVMRMMFSYDLLPAIHSSSFEAWKHLTPGRQDSLGAVISAFREQSQRVMVGVRAIIERSIQEGSSLVIDGVHLVPGLMGLHPFEDQAYLLPVVISTSDRERHLERFPIRQQAASDRSAQRYRKNFESISQLQNYILKMTARSDTPVIENNNFDEAVSTTLTIFSDRLRKQLNLSTQELASLAL